MATKSNKSYRGLIELVCPPRVFSSFQELFQRRRFRKRSVDISFCRLAADPNKDTPIWNRALVDEKKSEFDDLVEQLTEANFLWIVDE